MEILFGCYRGIDIYVDITEEDLTLFAYDKKIMN